MRKMRPESHSTLSVVTTSRIKVPTRSNTGGSAAARFIITKSGKPTAVVIGASDFDDMLEELDPEFQKSLKITAKELRAGKGITLEQYLKERLAGRRLR